MYSEIPAHDEQGKRVSQQEVRLYLERFADGYAEGMAQRFDEIATSSADITTRRLALEQLYSYGGGAIQIASGPYPEVAFLDMVVFVTLIRVALEEYWIPDVFGNKARPLIDMARRHENEIWSDAALVLTTEQRDQLRRLIEEWRERNPDRHYVQSVRFGDFIDQLDPGSQQAGAGLLGDVRRATDAADQALVLAERLTYFFQRAPVLWRMHAQMAYYEIIAQPEMQRLLGSVGQASASAERLSLTVEELSTVLLEGPTPEQDALLENLEGGEARLHRLLTDARQTLDATNQLVTNVGALAVQFNVGKKSDAPAKPFDIADYQTTAAEFSRMATEFRGLVESLNTVLVSPAVVDGLPAAVNAAQTRSEAILQYVVILVITVVVASIFSVLTAMLSYRYFGQRLMDRAARRSTKT